MFKSIKFVRVLREGWLSFYRDKWLTVATVSIMTLTLFLIGITIFLWIGVKKTVKEVEKQINISIYFDFDVEEGRIKAIKTRLENKELQEIKSITYISKEKALEQFKKEEKDDENMKKALEIVGENPFPASLMITASDTSYYNKIDSFFEQEYGDLVLSSNYKKNKNVITDIKNRIVFLRKATFFLSIVFFMVAILVTFNAVSMSIYTHRKEFEIMRLVGASNLYVKMPVIVEGVLYGLTSSFVAVILLIVTIYSVDPFAQRTLENVQIFDFYKGSIFIMTLFIIVISIILGSVSSYIAIRKYLER